jgi:hypothetical protein
LYAAGIKPTLVSVSMPVSTSLTIHRCILLSLTWTLGVAADDLDPVGMDLVRVVELEVDVFDNKRPDIVAEAVRIKMSL